MKKKWIVWIVVLALVAGGVGGYYWLRNRARSRRAARSNAGLWASAKVERRDLEITISGKGTVQSSSKRQIKPEAPGTVVSVLVREGDTVAAGQPILELQNDSLVMQMRQAEMDVSLAREALESLTGPAGTKAQAELNVRQAENNLANAEKKYNALNVKSPIAGQVWSLSVSAGDSVKAGQAIATIADTSTYRVSATVKQADLTRISVGAPVMVYAGGDVPPCRGTIESISQEGQNTGKGVEFPFKVRLIEPDPRVRSGMSVIVTYEAPDGSFLSFGGTVEALDKRTVYSEVDGTVDHVFVQEGTPVSKDGVIVSLKNDSVVLSYDSAVNALEKAKKDLESLESQIRQQELKLQQAELNFRDKSDMVSNLVVRSPISGRILTLSVNAGDDVTSGTVVATVASVEPLTVVISVDELDIAQVFPGQKATITVDALPANVYEGTVSKIAQEGTAKDGITNYNVEVQFAAAEVKLGMSATATIQVSKKTGVLTVPIEAVKYEQNQPYVYKIENNQPVQKRIKLGVQTDMYAEVLSGLSEGDMVFTGDLSRLNQMGNFRLPNQVPRLQMRPR